jgi:hypothetical protein
MFCSSCGYQNGDAALFCTGFIPSDCYSPELPVNIS